MVFVKLAIQKTTLFQYNLTKITNKISKDSFLV